MADKRDDDEPNWLDVPLDDYQATWEKWNAKQVAKEQKNNDKRKK